MPVARRYIDESKEIEDCIVDSHTYWRENITRYHKCRMALYKSCSTEEDIAFLNTVKWPQVECPVIKPYVSRLRGEWSKQTPTITVSAKSDQVSDPTLNEFLEGHFRAIIDDSNQSQFENEVFNDTVSGGFSVMKVYTEYESNSSFNQVIKLQRVYDPTLCGFDPIARLSHKGDGKYCFEHVPMLKEEVEEMFKIDLGSKAFTRNTDGFSWYYMSQKQKIAVVCFFYKKKFKTLRMVLLANGATIRKDEYQKALANWNDIAEPPKIVKERDVRQTIICRYTLVGGTVVDYQETDYAYLPLVFVDGDSQLLRNDEQGNVYQFTIPYIMNAIDAQRIKNFMAQAFLNEVESLVQTKFMMPIDALPHKDGQLQPWLNAQKSSILTYKQFDAQNRELQPPTPIIRPPIPPDIYNAFMGADEIIRNILSAFDPTLGVNQSSLSGVAIVEGATQSNAVAMPYIMNYMAALTQVATIILDLIPKYYVTPRTLPVIDGENNRAFRMINQSGQQDSISTQYDPSTLGVMVKAAVNFEVQKQRSLDTMSTMAQAFPAFGAMINQMGLGVLVSNLDIKGTDQLKDMAQKFQQEQEAQKAQQGQQQNPEMMALQLKAQQMQAETQYKQAQLQNDAQKNQADAQNDSLSNQIKMMQLEMQNQKMQSDSMIQQQQLQLTRFQTLLQAQLDARDQSIQIQKAQVEQESKLADLEMTSIDMGHKHALDIHDRSGKLVKP